VPSKLAAFLSYYEAAHRNSANRYVHHVAHALSVVGLLMLWRPVWGVCLIAGAFGLSWAGHFFLERNIPAFFDAPDTNTPAAGAINKLQVALGGVVWSLACFLRLFGRGPLPSRPHE